MLQFASDRVKQGRVYHQYHFSINHIDRHETNRFAFNSRTYEHVQLGCFAHLVHSLTNLQFIIMNRKTNHLHNCSCLFFFFFAVMEYATFHVDLFTIWLMYKLMLLIYAVRSTYVKKTMCCWNLFVLMLCRSQIYHLRVVVALFVVRDGSPWNTSTHNVK